MPNTSFYDFYQLGLAAAVGANPNLAVNEGDITDFLLAAGAAMADYCDQRRASDQLRTSVDGAEEADLTELSDDHFSVTRQAATPSSVTVSFTRPSAGGSEPAGVISAGFEIATPVDRVGGEVRFVIDTDASFPLGGLGPIAVQATSIVTGPGANVTIVGKVSRLIDTAFDSSIAVASTTVAAGGNGAESDADLRKRIRDRPHSFSRATRAALEFGALEVPAVRVSSASEDIANGNVMMAISDSDGNSNAQMINDTLLKLELWRALGIPIGVTGGVRVLVDLNIQITISNGAALAGLQAPIIASVTGEINKLSQGEFLYDTLWIASTKNIAPELIKDVTLTTFSVGGVATPIGDYIGTSSNELLRAGIITVTAQ